MTAQVHWLAALLVAGVLATAVQTTEIGVTTAHAAECSVCEFSDEEGEVFP